MRQRNLISSFSPNRRGFSLLELLIAIGILAAITAIALPMVLLAKKRGFEIRTRSDLALIGMALEAYKGEFGDYPRLDDTNAADDTAAGYAGDPLNIQQDRGARLLCRALMGPAQAGLTNGAKFGFNAQDSTEQAPDGADGPGFRLRSGGAGKVHAAYLDSSKFRLGNPAAPGGVWDSTYFKDATLLDQFGNSILYYPGFTSAVLTPTTATPKPVYVGNLPPQGISPATPPVRPFYNSYDNEQYGNPAQNGTYLLSRKHLEYILGDRDLNNSILTGETATTTAPYLLWTAGADGFFGFPGSDPSSTASLRVPIDPLNPPAGTALKCDDITNFDLPPDLRK